MELGVSVIVCCYNSAKRLPDSLRNLALQQVPAGIPWEVVIVNNRSTDNSTTVAKEEWARYQVTTTMKMVEENRPGLAYAREAGISAAAFEYLIFCDDDNWLCENYVATAYDIMHNRPSVGLAAGCGNAVCEITPPEWFEEKKGGYAVSTGFIPSGDITANGHVCGAGMILRRSVIQAFYKAGFRSLLTDRNGEALSSGGDAELSKWHILAGYTLWFDERLKYDHFIPKERLTTEYVTKLWAGFKTSAPIEIAYDRFINFQKELKASGRFFLFTKNSAMALLAFIYRTKFRSNLYLYAQNIQLCMAGLIRYDKNLLLVQKMLTKPLRQFRSTRISG
jgi:glycosyltransferase involved in cell wall biosynthesis